VLWDLLEKPQSSRAARLLSIFSILLVLVSTAGMCLNTLPSLADSPRLALLEAACIAYFTVEFLLRLAGAPAKLAFLRGALNIVDCLAILPYYLHLALLPGNDSQASDLGVQQAHHTYLCSRSQYIQVQDTTSFSPTPPTEQSYLLLY
jgi:hypothetical protein